MGDDRRQFLKTAAVAAPHVISAWSRLDRQSSQAEFPAPAGASQGFRVEMTVVPGQFRGARVILDIPGVLSVALRQHDPRDRARQNYPAFRAADGSVPVLEASLTLHSAEHPDWNRMTIGVPLAMVARPEGRHEVVLDFSGARWTMFVDGRLVDNDFPFGYPKWAERAEWRIDPEFTTEAAVSASAGEPANKALQRRLAAPIQYWTPPGHNSWVGDVAAIFHRGRYHLFYLFDRRHHQSKFGKGAHYFEHLSTKDFRSWTEHEAATPLEEQWECIGTGTPFVFKDRLCLSYGLHTGRVYAEEKTTWPAQWAYLKEHGATRAFRRGADPGMPAGATYAVSTDGVGGFRKSGVTFHPCQNPSVYTDPEGRLRMLANAGSKGMWASDLVDGGWRPTNAEFPPGGDCTFYFRWGRFDYIIGGFTGLWRKAVGAPDNAYEDLVRKGLDFYDGSNVPSITAIPGGRFVMAAWIPIRGWGGTLVLRELVQFADGRIGSKWMREVTPRTGVPKVVAASVSEAAELSAGSGAFLLTFHVEPSDAGGGRASVVLVPDEDRQAECEWRVDVGARRAQFGAGGMSLREGGAPEKALRYAVENLIGVDRAFEVRLMVVRGNKIGGCLVDVEIAGARTMMSYRPELSVRRVAFRVEGVRLADVRISAMDTASYNV